MTMQEQKEQLQGYLQERLTREISRLEDMTKRLPSMTEDTLLAMDDVPDTSVGLFYTTANIGQLRVDLPRNQKLIVEYLKQVGQGPWRPDKNYWANEQDNGNLYYHFFHEKLLVELTICFAADHEGATCRLVQTGLKKVPVYKVVCDDHEEPRDVSDTV